METSEFDFAQHWLVVVLMVTLWVISIIAADQEKTDKQIAEIRHESRDFMKEIREERAATNAQITELLRHSAPPSALTLQSKVTDANSPQVFTEDGEKVLTFIDAVKWATEMIPDVQDQVAGKPPYNIQESSIWHTTRIWKPDAEQDLKIGEAAYETGLTRHDVLYTVGIVLRDILLERNGYPVPKAKDKTDAESE